MMLALYSSQAPVALASIIVNGGKGGHTNIKKLS